MMSDLFGISLPSLSDVKNAVTSGASSALNTAESLGSSAMDQAKSLGRQGMDLGRSAVNEAGDLAGKADKAIASAGTSTVKAIGEAQSWAQHGISSGVTAASNGVHSAADYARSHITGSDPISSFARGAVTYAENQTRFDIGFVGGVGDAAVGLVGSVGQLGVLSTEYQLSPTARGQIDQALTAKASSAATSLSAYADSVAQNPSRVIGDTRNLAGSAGSWLQNQAAHPEQAGMTTGNLATYLVPIGGEARAVAGVGELATRETVGALVETGTRALVEDAARTSADVGVKAVATSGASTAAKDYGVAFFGESNLRYYNVDGATLGAPGRSFFLMPLGDSAVVTDAASAARYTGMSPSTLEAYTKGGDIYGLSFPTENMTLQTPTAADAGGWPHFLEGGHTAVRTVDGPTAGYLVNPTRELVTPGGNAVPSGSVLFKLDGDGAWAPVKRF